MQILRRAGYIQTEAVPGGVIISITKAKKFPQGARKIADGLRKGAASLPQNCAGDRAYPSSNLQIDEPIRSSSIALSQERNAASELNQDFHKTSSTCGNLSAEQAENPSSLVERKNLSPVGPARPGYDHQERPGAVLDARLLRQLLRAEREEAVRRELAVGTGPEVRRP